MVVEKLLKKKETREYPMVIPYKGYLCYDPLHTRIFDAEYTYWYDGRQFLIGKFRDEGLPTIVDVEIGVHTVKLPKMDLPLLIQKFKTRLSENGGNIHNVVVNFKNRLLTIDLCLTGVLF